jgi:acyl-CoA synthetase (AMP-forming)/AMP-acid ligase II
MKAEQAVPLDDRAAAASAARSTVYSLFCAQVRMRPEAPAIEWEGRHWTYRELAETADRFAGALRRRGMAAGDRIAVLSENRVEYTLLQLAAARIGAIVACLNWRLAPEELAHCAKLAEPRVLFVSSRYAGLAAEVGGEVGEPYSIEECLRAFAVEEPDHEPPFADPECGLLLLNTSGTTGLPKAALISHRAAIARMTVLRMDLGIGPDDAYLAWSPMFHMGGSEHTLSSLMFGAQVIITDGLDIDSMVDIITRTRLGWLLLVPATIEPLLERLKKVRCRPKGVKVVGCMADLVPGSLIAKITKALNAPFLNSFGSTETGLPPLTGHLIPVGHAPEDLTKRLSSLCEFRLVDRDGGDVADGATGEGVMRGPTLFSGYWNAPDVNREEFRGGWFHMGDLFRRTEAGGFEFVGRAKYMIKSGGENIYPAEIERVLLSDSRVADAAVVRKRDQKWGEVPVAFIVRTADDLSELDIEFLCRRRLAGYKRPREVHFVGMDELPRNATGKILREELERRLEELPVDNQEATPQARH